MAIEQEVGITDATIRRHDSKTMVLRQGLGEGEVEDDKFDISINLSNGDPTWYFSKEGRYYSVSLKALTAEVVKFKEEVAQSNKGG